ncbi:MAG: hypothetical protein ACRD43_05775, partial [Pyrinomonadaceae bacterium]
MGKEPEELSAVGGEHLGVPECMADWPEGARSDLGEGDARPESVGYQAAVGGTPSAVEPESRMTADEERLLDELGIFGESRRRFLGQASAVGIGVLVLDVLAEQRVLAFEDAGAFRTAEI